MTTRHRWADVIIAWAEGKEIQSRYMAPGAAWTDHKCPTSTQSASFMPAFNDVEYLWRVKPETKTGWIAIHKDGLRISPIHTDRFDAQLHFGASQTAACLPITYTEGEGL